MMINLGLGSARKAFLEYEVAASPIAPLIWFGWGQNLISSYLAWKTNRKYDRYLKFLRDRRKYTPNHANPADPKPAQSKKLAKLKTEAYKLCDELAAD